MLSRRTISTFTIPLLVAMAACGEQTPAPNPSGAEQGPEASEIKTELPPPATPQPANADNAFAEDGGWDTDQPGQEPSPAAGADAQPATEAAEPAADAANDAEAANDAPAPTEPYRGPCKVRWTSGSILRFKYTDGGGSVRVDNDGDGKSDVCASFEHADGKTTKLEVDNDCDKSIDLEFTPKYDPKSNVATATYIAMEGGTKTSRDITLVTLPSFVGLAPGFLLQAGRSALKLRISKKLVRSATVAEPVEGPKTKVTFDYDSKGRIKRIKEDLELDGTTDRRFDYSFDEIGNVTRMSVVSGSAASQSKASARIDYSCWK